jgi:hypothetical protein
VLFFLSLFPTFRFSLFAKLGIGTLLTKASVGRFGSTTTATNFAAQSYHCNWGENINYWHIGIIK